MHFVRVSVCFHQLPELYKRTSSFTHNTHHIAFWLVLMVVGRPKEKKNERTVGEPKRTQHHRHIYIIVGYIVIGKKKKRKKRKTFTNSNGGLMPCVMTLNVCRWGPTSSAHPFLSDSRLRITKIFFFAFYLCSSVQPTMELLSTSHRTGKEEKKNKNMIEMYFSDGNVYVFIHPECGNRIRRS